MIIWKDISFLDHTMGAFKVGDVEYTQIGLYAGAFVWDERRKAFGWVMRLRSCGEMHRRRRPAATRHLEMAGLRSRPARARIQPYLENKTGELPPWTS